MADAQSTTVRPMIIYGLVDSGAPDVIRYVGKTLLSRRPDRLQHHLYTAKSGRDRTYKANWIRSVLSVGRTVHDVILAYVESEAEANALECELIARYRQKGSLTNLTDGGDGTLGHLHSNETKAKIGRYIRTPSHRAATRARLIGHSVSGKTRLALSVAKLGVRHTPETRAKMSATRTGKPLSAAHRASCKVAQQNKTPETRRKLSDAAKQQWQRQETIAKMRAAVKAHWATRTDRRQSSEHRRTRSESMKRTWARKREAAALEVKAWAS